MPAKFWSAFWWIAGIAIALKFWLTASIEIDSIFAPHDYTNFLDHALSIFKGRWFGDYTDLTLIKGPGMPLYLALIARLGLPLPFAHQLLFAAASLAVCLAMRPLVRSGRMLGIAFVVLLFDPWTFSATAWIANRSQLMDSLTLFVLAGAIGAFVRAREPLGRIVPWMLLLGVSVTWFGLTREDTLWIVAPIVVFGMGYAWRVGDPRRADRRASYALLAIPLGIFVVAFGTVMSINARTYGWATTVETTSPEFVSAYQSMARIIVPGMDNRTFPAPAAARDLAYASSPAAAELRANFDPNHDWRKMICNDGPGCDLSSGFFIWAFRDAVAGAGYYRSGADARAYYIRLSRELDAACDAGRLHCRPKSFGEAPNVYPSDIPGIAYWTAQALWHGITFDQWLYGGPATYDGAGHLYASEYRSVADSAIGNISVYSGWMIKDARSSVTIFDPAGKGDLNTLAFQGSPDVASAYGNAPEWKGADVANARFELDTTCLQGCELVVDTPGKAAVRVALGPNLGNVERDGIFLHIDSISTDPPQYLGSGPKIAVLEQIAAAYQQIVRWWLLLAVVLFAVRGIRLFRKHRAERSFIVIAVATGVVAAAVADCLALGLVSAISFDALFPEYEIAISPLLLLALGFQLATDGEVAYRYVRSKIPGQKQPVAATN